MHIILDTQSGQDILIEYDPMVEARIKDYFGPKCKEILNDAETTYSKIDIIKGNGIPYTPEGRSIHLHRDLNTSIYE